MADLLTWYAGDRNPSVTQLISVDAVPVDLIGLGATVDFRMRAAGATANLVDATAVIVEAETALTSDRGIVRYDWGAGDLDTPGTYIIRWPVTINGKQQTVAETVIQVLTPAPAGYIDLETVKITLNLTGQTAFDQDLTVTVEAASRAIDAACGRRFYLDRDNTSVRTYTPDGWRRVMIDDLVDLATLKVDQDGDGTFEETWTVNTDFVLEPLNAASDSKPYEAILARQLARRYFPKGIESSVEVTGQFGWAAIPADIRLATGILAGKLFKRAREAPFGIVSFGSDTSTAMRIAKTDPDVANLISGYIRRTPFL